MKYEYTGVTGKTEIEVDEQFYELLVALDQEEFNSNRKHSRRHPISLDGADYEGEWFSDEADILGDLIRAESSTELRAALAGLSPAQRDLIERVYYKNEKIIDIADEQGVSQPAISQRLATAIKKMKKII